MRTRITMTTIESLLAKDNARNPIRWFVSWGIPLLAMATVNVLRLPGTLGPDTIIGSFAWIGVACLTNALRCSRVHCWFTGPWCLMTAAVLLGISLRAPVLAQLPFSWLANIGGVGALILWLVPELFLGKYFLAHPEQ